jgi:hypothetical protein
VHAIVTGYGPTLRETLGDLDDLATQLPSFATIIVWLNENWARSGTAARASRTWPCTSNTASATQGSSGSPSATLKTSASIWTS